METLKVGDKFKSIHSGTVKEIKYVGKGIVVYQADDEDEEWAVSERTLFKENEPYKEPAPARKIVAFESIEDENDGYVVFAVEGTHKFRRYSSDSDLKRIEITPEMLFGEGR